MSDRTEVSTFRAAMVLTGKRRAEIAKILKWAAKDGLPTPFDLDVALDAIEIAYMLVPNDD